MKRFEVGYVYTDINNKYSFECLNIFTSYKDGKRYVVVSDSFDLYKCFEILEDQNSEYFEYGSKIKIRANTVRENENKEQKLK